MDIAITIGFVFLIFFFGGGRAPNEKKSKIKSNGNGNAHADLDWYFVENFFKMDWPHLAQPHLGVFILFICKSLGTTEGFLRMS